MLSSLFAVNTASGTPLPLTDPVYIFCILLLAIATAPLIAKLLRLPPLVVLIILGAILGSNVLGILARDSQLILLEKIGLLYIMLLAGLQMDLSKFRQVGVRSLIFGLLTFGLPLTIGIVSGHGLTTSFLGSALLGILYSPHTLVSYPIVTVLGIVQKEAVAVAIGGTIVTSILTLSGLSIVQAIAGGSVGILLWIKLLILLPLLVLICLWGIPKFGQRFLFNQSVPSLSNQFIFILGCLFLTASAALLLGVDSIVGAFIAGLSLNPLIKNEKTLMERVEFVGNSLFIPAFLISVGILSNPRILFTHPENLGLALIVVTGAVGGKFLAAWIAGLFFRYSFAEIMTILGLTMSRAALVLVVALYGKQVGLLNEGLFNAIIFYILITCLIGPLVTNYFGKKVAGN
ncbi:cation:proton antiporter [Chlorogloeopsis sp. ULAP01]|uniref:cation:proton antiporter n=1 Tax=Chlorogloeopsis sp. ULAP01 TaxID=3056483 RepID=UPI0025AB3969|nr:cation:proton antiporter [Chlorogloeopsis sp. ULAP01]MDM9382193.1 cation:proton antiporter [Chlorogloeopsis sp. ULAP01]